MNKNIFYVYAYLRSKDSETAKAGAIYYFGKGRDDRAYAKHGRVKVPKDRANIIFISENLSEEDAHILEIKMIKQYGRVDLGTGTLRNLTEGGEGSTGYKHSEEVIQQMKISRSGENSSRGMLGKKQTEETKIKRGVYRTGKEHYSYGKHPSNESRQKMSESQTGRKDSPETKANKSIAKAGENHPMFGKSHTEESNQKNRDAHLGILQDIVVCPHCNKSGGSRAMKRYHFDICKLDGADVKSFQI